MGLAKKESEEVFSSSLSDKSMMRQSPTSFLFPEFYLNPFVFLTFFATHILCCTNVNFYNIWLLSFIVVSFKLSGLHIHPYILNIDFP